MNVRRADMKLQQHCSILFDSGTNVILERLDFSSVYLYCKNILLSIPNNIKFFLITTGRKVDFLYQRFLRHLKQLACFRICQFVRTQLIIPLFLYSLPLLIMLFNILEMCDKNF